MNANVAGSVVQRYESEPLYLLAEDNNEVYVDNFLMEQHQIDGLRFLFNQFNKKSPGVIVNFPPSCGKSATVAIFLNAVTNVLKNPVLILCKDDSALQYWKQILLKWSSYVEDHIAVESSNAFLKGKKVFLKKREYLYSYLRRRWSIVVIKENVVSKDVFKLAFEADFKMCITATDIKKDASLLTAVFNWLYPKSKVNISDFVAKENHPREKFRKSVQLDSILEDVAIRRYVNLKPFQTNEKADNVREIETNMTAVEINYKKGPLKNKDATGTKVKRSKTTRDDTTLSTPSNQNDEVINELSGQAFIFINDLNKTSDLNVNLNSILMNDQLTNNTSDQNFILINDQVISETSNQNFIFINDQAVNETSNQNVIFIDEQVLKGVSNQNFILMNDQIVNEPSDQNVISIDEQVLNESMKQNFTLTNNHISNRNSNRNIILMNDQIVNEPSDQNVILVDEQVLNKTMNQNVTLTTNHIPNRNSNRNIILKHDQIVNEPSDQNVILIDKEVLKNTMNQNVTLTNNHISNRKSNQNIILKDDQIVNEPSNQNVTSTNNSISNRNSNQNAILTDKQLLNYLSNRNFVLTNDHIVKDTSDQNVISINDNDKNESDVHIKNNDVCNKITVYDTPMINKNDDFDRGNINDFPIDNGNNRVKLNGCKSPINNVINNLDTSDDQDSFKLDVDNFIDDQQPVAPVIRFNKLSRLYEKAELNINAIEKTLKLKKIHFDESINIDSDSKVDPNEIKDLDDKDLLKEQLIESLHLNNSKVKEETKDLEVTFIKEESTEDKSLNFKNNSKLDLNEMKDLRKQLIESLGFDSECKLAHNEIKNSESKNSSNVNLNERKNLRNKCLLQKQLMESLGLNNDCQEVKKSINENNNNEINDCKDFDKTLIKEESEESLSLGGNSKVEQNEIRNDINVIKEEPAESINFCSNPKVDINEMKDLHNKTMLQKQLIESLGLELDDVKPEIKVEENDEQNNINENMRNAVQQIATDLENDEMFVMKIESQDGNEMNTERNVNNVSSKRKSDVSDKDLDNKILEMEEKALKKFKGSFLDSIF